MIGKRIDKATEVEIFHDIRLELNFLWLRLVNFHCKT